MASPPDFKMKINNLEVFDRHNRPSVTQPVLLRSFFINDGVYQDPYAISSVHVFTKAANSTPKSILDGNNLVKFNSTTSSNILMRFTCSADGVINGPDKDASFDSNNYFGDSSNREIYKLSDGQFGVVLNGSPILLGTGDNIHEALQGELENGVIINNQASAVNDYIDVWTVKMLAGSNWQVFINQFHLYDDTFFVSTEPLLLKPKNQLITKHIRLGSQIDLKMMTEITVENKNIDNSVKNLFKDSAIMSAAFQIVKVNEDPNLPSRVEVSGYSDTSSTLDVTSDNTMIWNWDTNKLKSHPEVIETGNLGNLKGTYLVNAKYTLLNQLIITPDYYLIVD